MAWSERIGDHDGMPLRVRVRPAWKHPAVTRVLLLALLASIPAPLVAQTPDRRGEVASAEARMRLRSAVSSALLLLAGCDAPNPITRAVATVARHYFLAGVAVGALGMLAIVVLVMIATERRRDQ